MTFQRWMAAVDRIIAAKCGFTSADLPDVCYADWFDDGVSPKSAASRAMRAAAE